MSVLEDDLPQWCECFHKRGTSNRNSLLRPKMFLLKFFHDFLNHRVKNIEASLNHICCLQKKKKKKLFTFFK